MNSDQNRQIVLDAWKAFATQDPAKAAPFFTEDAEWIAPPSNATAVALDGPSHMVGRDVIAAFATQGFRRMFSEVEIEFLTVAADGDTVVVEERMRAQANGRPYDLTYCFIYKLQDGRIRQVREYMDTLSGERMIFGEARAHALGV